MGWVASRLWVVGYHRPRFTWCGTAAAFIHSGCVLVMAGGGCCTQHADIVSYSCSAVCSLHPRSTGRALGAPATCKRRHAQVSTCASPRSLCHLYLYLCKGVMACVKLTTKAQKK